LSRDLQASQARGTAALLTIVTTTHLIPSAPSVWILRKTLHSLRRRMQVSGCEHRIYYDAPSLPNSRHAAYLDNLKVLAASHGLEVLVRPGSGLKANYLHAVDTVQTPYMLFLEHDWTFRRDVDLPRLLQVLERHAFVNYVKFNKKANDARFMWDHFVEPEDRVAELPLTRTSGWSNNPHIARLSKWRSSWRQIVGERPEPGSSGIEEKLYFEYGKGIFTQGFRETHADWGCMLYGALEDPAMVRHINGSLSRAWYAEPFAKLRRLAQRQARRFRQLAT
jgi:hypothetical protein